MSNLGRNKSTWYEQQHSQDSSEESDIGTHSREGSPVSEKPHRRIPGYILEMDSQQYNPDTDGGSGRVSETAELVCENEELWTALGRLQEQMASLVAGQAEARPAVHFSRPAAAQATQSDLNDWILRQQLKKHTIRKFLGAIDYEAVLLWTEAVSHFALLAGLNNNATITAAWTAIEPEILVWFKAMLEADYDYKFVATAMDYPFSCEQVKTKFAHRYSPAFAVESGWNSLEALKRGTGTTALQEFNTKFLELASIYVKKMTARERDILSAIAISAYRDHKVITLDDAMAITDDQAVIYSLTVGSRVAGNSVPIIQAFTSFSHPTAPAPIDLSVITSYPVAGTRRDRNVCTRCGGKGHWLASCGTKPEWKEGDPVSGYRGRGGTSRGTRTFGARRRGGTGALHLMGEGVGDSGIAVDGVDTADDGIAGSQELPKN
ncbi:hypothetical protein B9Z19DRAFT_1132958 [Tuber borchii]|uniref:CCHC-type domain-containing protein n=1 Tax=Tuber borchii TaxID=42251 RepID=A0A2T6ZGM2_TUBBO|nr:hypothetical protein B9Z19DRAFT_1132958 [Tuber borchii]